MIGKTVIALLLLFSTSSSHAETADQLCTAGGYYSGAQDRFLSGLATHILNQRNQLSTPACGALWKEAAKVGEHFSKTGKLRPSDERVISESANFSRKIYDAISRSSGL